MVVDVAQMGNIGTKFLDHRAHLRSSGNRVNGLGSEPGLCNYATRRFEICRRHQVLVVLSRWTSWIRHREQHDLMPAGSHAFHCVKQVRLGAAEPVVIFVAVQDSHGDRFLCGFSPFAVLQELPGISKRNLPDWWWS